MMQQYLLWLNLRVLRDYDLYINHSIHMQIMFCKKMHLCIQLNYFILGY